MRGIVTRRGEGRSLRLRRIREPLDYGIVRDSIVGDEGEKILHEWMEVNPMAPVMTQMAYKRIENARDK